MFCTLILSDQKKKGLRGEVLKAELLCFFTIISLNILFQKQQQN